MVMITMQSKCHQTHSADRHEHVCCHSTQPGPLGRVGGVVTLGSKLMRWQQRDAQLPGGRRVPHPLINHQSREPTLTLWHHIWLLQLLVSQVTHPTAWFAKAATISICGGAKGEGE